MPLRRAALVLACALLAGPAGAGEPELRVSLLAVGDTGGHDSSQDLAVAEGIAEEDARAPADALLLLGDNFYPHGLRRKELEERIARNVVQPWCRFVALTAPRSAEVQGACKLDADERRSGVPIYAVLGNHDYQSPESPELQREAIPQFVANWRVPFRSAERVDLDGGLSLVLFDSVELAVHNRGGAELSRALSRTRGPWRIVVAHHPPIQAELTREERLYRERLARALAAAGVPVHLILTGHEHSLQVIELGPPWPLVVIAGSGSDRKDIETRDPGLRFAKKEHGFARVDLVAEAGVERLRVSLFTTPEHPLYPGGPELVSAWSVDRDGRARPEPPAGR